MDSPLSIHDVHRASELLEESPGGDSPLELREMRGRLVELAARRGHPQISFAVEILARAHRRGEPAAWIGSPTAPLHPPDAAGWTLDWSALAVVHLDDAKSAARAADKLLRSGGFGVVAVDLAGFGSNRLSSPLCGRLLRLAESHDSALVFLTEASETDPSISPMVGLRAHLRWVETGPERLCAELTVVKDKRRGPGRRTVEQYDGPLGLR